MGCLARLCCKKKKPSSSSEDTPEGSPKEPVSPPPDPFWLFKKMWPLPSPFSSSSPSFVFYDKPTLVVEQGFVEFKKK